MALVFACAHSLPPPDVVCAIFYATHKLTLGIPMLQIVFAGTRSCLCSRRRCCSTTRFKSSPGCCVGRAWLDAPCGRAAAGQARGARRSRVRGAELGPVRARLDRATSSKHAHAGVGLARCVQPVGVWLSSGGLRCPPAAPEPREGWGKAGLRVLAHKLAQWAHGRGATAICWKGSSKHRRDE